MAFSKPLNTYTIQDVPVIAQHFLICGNEDCKKNCSFTAILVINQCVNNADLNIRNVKSRSIPTEKTKIPVEKCKNHPFNAQIIHLQIQISFEKTVQVPLCSKCAVQDNQRQMSDDPETVYSNGFFFYINYDIQQYFLPTSNGIQNDIEEDVKDLQR